MRVASHTRALPRTRRRSRRSPAGRRLLRGEHLRGGQSCFGQPCGFNAQNLLAGRFLPGAFCTGCSLLRLTYPQLPTIAAFPLRRTMIAPVSMMVASPSVMTGLLPSGLTAFNSGGASRVCASRWCSFSS